MLLLGLLLACIAVECGVIAGAIFPFALILILVGILLFHCGWAAHLMDWGGAIPTDETVTTTTRTTRSADEDPDEEMPIFESVETKVVPDVRQGFWQFDEDSSWQAVANPYPIQHTLKPVVERQPYVP
uniref:Uncharacterized protein n=1 Tax=Acrobeloides nanus TaxID=290746 RepID=A0A914EFW1_9BILA